jgi:cysteine desulfurase
VQSMNVDLMSLSAHKMYGPKGVGALYVRTSRPVIRLVAQIDGGGHERGIRSGTLNVPAIVGFGSAADIARQELGRDAEHTSRLRDELVHALVEGLEDVKVNGHPTERLPNNANLTFEGADADRLMMDMKDLAVSTGSACSPASPAPSHVLQAIGLSPEGVRGTIRIGLGRFTTKEEISYATARIVETVHKQRGMTSQRYTRVGSI